MSDVCAIRNCKENSRVLCHCCKNNLCLNHLSNHSSLINSQSYSLTDQIRILNQQIKKLNMEKLVDDGKRKLDKWKDDTLKKIDHYYKQKCDELDRYSNQTFYQQQNQIEHLYKQLNDYNQSLLTIENINSLEKILFDTKQNLDAIEQNGILINIRPLIINKNLILIGESKLDEFDLTNLSTTYQTLHYSQNLGGALSANDRYILIDQNPNLSLIDSDGTIVEQCLWKYGNIYDICWSSLLFSFIIITEKNKAFLVNGNNLSINSIQSMNNQLWILCTCSNSILYLVSITNAIVEYILLPAITYIRRWDPPITAKKDESIKDINSNQSTLALIITSSSLNSYIYLSVRSLTTFEQLFTIRLDIIYSFNQLPIRSCPIKYNEWIIIDANTSQIFHIDKYGKIKGTLIYDSPPFNARLFNSNRLAITTQHTIHFHHLFY